jgi:hypothetical protein
MSWVQIQKAKEIGWDEYARLADALGDEVPEGLIYHAAGAQENGKWQSVSVWESEDDFNRFRDERLLPLIRQVAGDELADAGPPPTEWFEAKRVLKR